MKLLFEQAAYGSFSFWNRGYGILTHSEGCRPEWLAELRNVCQRYGEPPAGAADVDGLFSLRLKSGPFLIAGVQSQGCDDRGRPGALAFHALFVNRWAYRWAGSDPFAFAHQIRGDWSADDQSRSLPRGQLSCPWFRLAPTPASDRAQVTSIVTALTQRRRVVVQSSTPINTLARNVWDKLPGRVRMRTSVATWAFDTANGFDLVALPKLAGIVLDNSDVTFAFDPADR